MLKGAPPMLVVGAVLRVAVIALQIALWLFQEPALAHQARTLAFAAELTAGVMVATGALELAARTRGRVRVGCVIAAIGQAGGVVVTIAVTVLLGRLRGSYRIEHDYALIQTLQVWCTPLAANLTIVGFVVAAGGRAIGAAIGAIACTVMVSPVPPVVRVLSRVLDSTAGIVGYCTLYLALALFVIRLGAVIARAGEVVTRDHERAVRGARIALAAVVLRALMSALLVVIAFTTEKPGMFDSLVDTDPRSSLAFVVDMVELLALVALVRGTWLMARAHHPSLATGTLHIAVACALGALIAFAYMLQLVASIDFDDLFAILPEWWLDLGATLTLGWVVVVVGRLSRHAPVVKRSVVFGGALFTLAACASIAMHRHTAAAALLAIVANLALVPVLRATARAIAADPIKSTADVFA